MPLSCAQCQEWIQVQLDGQEPSADEMELHLRSCQECWGLLHATRRLQHGLRCLAPVEAPPGLANSIAAMVLQDYRLRQRRRKQWLVGSLVAAAALFLVALSNRLVDWLRPNPTTETIVKNHPEPQAPEEVAPSLTLKESVSEVTAMVTSTASHTADVTLAEARNFLPRLPTPSPMPGLEASSRPLVEAGQNVADGMAPVTDTARRAVDLFFRELPTLNLDDKAGL